MKKLIGILGAPSSGKSTFSMELTAYLKKIPEFCSTQLIIEYARTYIEENGGTPPSTVYEQYFLMSETLKKTDMASEIYDYVITDGAAWCSYFFALFASRFDTECDLKFLDKAHRMLMKDILRYDKFYLLHPNQTHKIDDGIRVSNYESYLKIYSSLKGMLDAFRVDYEDLEVNFDRQKKIKEIKDYMLEGDEDE